MNEAREVHLYRFKRQNKVTALTIIAVLVSICDELVNLNMDIRKLIAEK